MWFWFVTFRQLLDEPFSQLIFNFRRAWLDQQRLKLIFVSVFLKDPIGFIGIIDYSTDVVAGGLRCRLMRIRSRWEQDMRSRFSQRFLLSLYGFLHQRAEVTAATRKILLSRGKICYSSNSVLRTVALRGGERKALATENSTYHEIKIAVRWLHQRLSRGNEK